MFLRCYIELDVIYLEAGHKKFVGQSSTSLSEYGVKYMFLRCYIELNVIYLEAEHKIM